MKDLEKYIAECEANARPDNKIDTSDIPEVTKEEFEQGHFKYYKPVKKSVTVRIDPDVLAVLKSQGKGYQTRINEILRKAVML